MSAAEQRVTEVQRALDRWRDATDIDAAHRAAETVSNLITGPAVDLYGDADGDGAVQGDVDAGLLPGQDGEASLGLPLSGCAGPDLLGGSWDDPSARWADLETKIADWTRPTTPSPSWRATRCGSSAGPSSRSGPRTSRTPGSTPGTPSSTWLPYGPRWTTARSRGASSDVAPRHATASSGRSAVRRAPAVRQWPPATSQARIRHPHEQVPSPSAIARLARSCEEQEAAAPTPSSAARWGQPARVDRQGGADEGGAERRQCQRRRRCMRLPEELDSGLRFGELAGGQPTTFHRSA